MSMVPTVFPLMRDAWDVEVYAARQPAYEVGGDFYDIFWLTPDRLCVLVADVSDKGASAALHMARAKASIRFCASVMTQAICPTLQKWLNALIVNYHATTRTPCSLPCCWW